MTRNGELELPPGFRFHPTDEELVKEYLIRKCSGLQVWVPIIKEIDLYKFDPWELPQKALYGEKEWYFFSPRDRKYPNGSRPNRAAGSGYWKATGADKAIGKPKALGIKKALVFYAGKAPRGVKTNWIMHEYRLANVDRSAPSKHHGHVATNNNHPSRLDDWVLCRIYNKKGQIEKSYPMPAVADQSFEDFQEMEDQKPNIAANPKTTYFSTNDDQNMLSSPGESDSVPKLHTDSSSSEEHVLSPEMVTCDREVQSHHKNDSFLLDNNAFVDFDFSNYHAEDPFAPQVEFQMDQLSSFQDMFTFLQNQF